MSVRFVKEGLNGHKAGCVAVDALTRSTENIGAGDQIRWLAGLAFLGACMISHS